MAHTSPPRSRGSAHGAPHARSLLDVSPALAGIGPRPVSGRPRSRSLPRARGDRPRAKAERLLADVSPPRSRGSARRRPAPAARLPVSPALAGIGPPTPACGMGEPGLPRARGDRPVPALLAVARTMSPPRSRGSAPHDREGRARGTVSPALAGIGRSRPRGRGLRGRLPRARGDRPIALTTE